MLKPETLERKYQEVLEMVKELESVKLPQTSITMTTTGLPLMTSTNGSTRASKFPSFVYALLTRYFIEYEEVQKLGGWVIMSKSLLYKWAEINHQKTVSRLQKKALKLGIIKRIKVDKEKKEQYAKYTYYDIDKAKAIHYLKNILGNESKTILLRKKNLSLMNQLAVDSFKKETYPRSKEFYHSQAKPCIDRNDKLTNLQKSNLHRYYQNLIRANYNKFRKRELNEQRVTAMKTEFPEFIELKKQVDPENHFKFLEEGNLRLTSPYVSTLNPRRAESDRYQKMSEYLKVPANRIEEIDLNGEAFRNAYLIGNGEVFPFDQDIYQSLWEHMDLKEEDYWDKKKFGVFNSDIRKIIKTFIMSVFTRPYQVQYINNRYYRLKEEARKFKNQLRKFYEYQGVQLEENQRYIVQLHSDYKDVPNNRFSTYDVFLLEAGNYVVKTMGINFNTFITKFELACRTFFNWKQENYSERVLFNLHSSNIQLLILKMLQERGIKVTTVYDCFYFKKGKMSRQELNEIYEMAQITYNLTLEENHSEYLSKLRNI